MKIKLIATMLIALGLNAVAQDYVGQKYAYTCWYSCFVGGKFSEGRIDDVIAHTKDEAIETLKRNKFGVRHFVITRIEQGRAAEGNE